MFWKWDQSQLVLRTGKDKKCKSDETTTGDCRLWPHGGKHTLLFDVKTVANQLWGMIWIFDRDRQVVIQWLEELTKCELKLFNLGIKDVPVSCAREWRLLHLRPICKRMVSLASPSWIQSNRHRETQVCEVKSPVAEKPNWERFGWMYRTVQHTYNTQYTTLSTVENAVPYGY